MCKTSPRKFWKYINKYKNKSKANNCQNLNAFVDHFSRICNTQHSRFNADDFSQSRDSPVHVEQLDTQITIDEISKTISSLNRNKSADYQNIVADFFIDANYFISKYLCVIFNKIFETGVYPDSWCKGIIVPIHKKGDHDNPSNYRGITLVNCMAKFFR